MSGPPPPVEYDPRRLFPFGLSPIPEVPSELASEVSSVYSYYEEEESEVGSEDEEGIPSPTSIMYSGSCSSVKSNRTLDPDESDEKESDEKESDEETDVEEEEEEDDEETTEMEDNSVERKSDEPELNGEHYNSSVTHVMHQRAFTSSELEEETTQQFDTFESQSSFENSFCVVESQAINVENQVYSVENQIYSVENGLNELDDSQSPIHRVEVSPGAATASEIFRHLQATTHDKEEITNELAKILDVLHTTLEEEESCSSSGTSASDSDSRSSTEEEPEQTRELATDHVQVPKPEPSKQVRATEKKPTETPQTVPLGKPPKYPGFRNRALGPEIEERIRELSTTKPGRSGKEEMQILSKILVTLLCSCRSAAATQELKKIIRHFKEAASEAGDEFGTEEFDLQSTTSSNRPKRKKSRRRRRRWSSGANSSHSSHGSEADSQTNTLTPCNTDSKSSGTDDERDHCPPAQPGKNDPMVSTRLRFNVIVEDPPLNKGQPHPEHNVSFTISLPRRSSIEMSGETIYATSNGVSHQVEQNQEEIEDEDEWEWEEDDDTGETAQDSNRQDSIDSGSMTTRKLLTDMEFGAYNSDSFGSPSAGNSGPSGEQSNNQSPSAIESRPESSTDITKKRSGRSREGSTSNNNLFTHLEETFKVLNGAYKIITGSKPDASATERSDDPDSNKSFEEVLEGVSNECVQLENEIRKTSRPTSKMSTCSRRSAVSKRGTDDDTEEQDEDGWEYYYEDEDDEEEEEPEPVVMPPPEPVKPVFHKPVEQVQNHKIEETVKAHQSQNQSRPSSRQLRSRPTSRAGSRPNSRLRTKTPLGDVVEDDENGDWEWEYYYEEEGEEGEEELRRLSPTTTTAPTTRATSPFPPELHYLQRAQIVSPLICWEEVDNRGGPYIYFQPGEVGFARETLHADVMCDSMISVVLAAEYLGQTAQDLAAVLPPNFMQEDKKRKKKKEDKKERKSNRRGKDGKFLPKVGVRELVNRLEPKLFQDADTGTKMVMDQAIASSAIAKQKIVNGREENCQNSSQTRNWSEPVQPSRQVQPVKQEQPLIIHDASNPNQVTVHQGGQATVVTMRRSCGNGARTKDPIKQKQRSPSEGSEAYGTGSTTSAVEQTHLEEYDDQAEEGRGHSRHSRLFKLLQDSDYTDSESESRQDFNSSHRISLKSVDDLVGPKESDIDSICSIERKHSFRSIRSSGKESDCDSITSSGRGIGGPCDKSNSMQKEMAVKRFMTLSLHGRDFYTSSSELSTPTSPTAPDCPQLMSPERRRAQYRHSSAFEDSGPTRGTTQNSKASSRMVTSPPKAPSDIYRGSPIRNSPKLELELLELVHLPSAPSFALRNFHNRQGKP